MPKISVIIPCYNAQKYINKCIDSLLCQTLADFEIICVDDGSTDETPAILKKYAGSDSRIRVLEQKNLYAGVARNNGLAVAEAEYVIFLDSDDFFAENMLEVMYEKIVEDDADVCLCDAYKYYSDIDKSFLSDDYIKYSNLPEVTPFNKHDVPDKIFNLGANVPWNKMFRKKFITDNSLEFQNIKQANDTYFVLMAIFLADKITYVRNRLIHYRNDSQGSITSGKAVVPPYAFQAYSFLRDALEKREDYSEENRLSFLNRAARGMLRVLHMPMSEKEYLMVREFLINTGFNELGLIFEAEKYESRWIYDDIQSILTNSATEHLIYKFDRARVSKDKIKSRAIKSREAAEKRNRQLEKAQAKNLKLEEKLSDVKEQLQEKKLSEKELKKELKTVKKERDSLDRTLSALRRKWYVRLFNKLERVFKGTKK